MSAEACAINADAVRALDTINHSSETEPRRRIIALNRFAQSEFGENEKQILVAYSGRLDGRVLLEGAACLGAEKHGRFSEVAADNSAIFNSKEPSALRSLLSKHQVSYILCVPGTDIAADVSKCPFLQAITADRVVKLYRVIID